MRYPVDEESDSNDLWDLPFDNTNGVHRPIPSTFYDSTLSEYTPPDSNSDERLSSEVNILGHPARPRTPQPSNTGSPDHPYLGPMNIASVGELDLEPGRSDAEPTSSRRIGVVDHPSNMFDGQSYSNEFVPTISINVPSRRTHRRLNRRTRNTTWYGTSSLSQNSLENSAHAEPGIGRPGVSAFTPPQRVASRNRSSNPEYINGYNYPHRPRSPSRIPTLITNPLFNDNFGDNEHEGRIPISSDEYWSNERIIYSTANITNTDVYNARAPITDFRILSESNPAVARFIHPTFAMLANIHGNQINRNSMTIATQTDAPTESAPLETVETIIMERTPSQSDVLSVSDSNELEFDDSHELIISDISDSSNLRDILSFNRPSEALDRDSPSTVSCNQDSVISDGRASVDTSTASNISLLSGLSRRSRVNEIAAVASDESSAEDSDSNSGEDDTSTPTRNEQSPSKDDDRSTPTLELTTDSECSTKDELEKTAGPSNYNKEPAADAKQPTELQAEIVVNNDVIFQNGRCRIIFDSLHSDDLTHLLSQDVSVKLEKGNILRLNITPVPESSTGRDSPRSIYRTISRYMGGSVLPGHVKKVSFSEQLTREEVFVETISEELTSSNAAPLPEWSDNENDIISDVEEFEHD